MHEALALQPRFAVRSIHTPCVATRAGTCGPRPHQRAEEGPGWQTASYRARGPAQRVSGEQQGSRSWAALVHAPGGRKAGSLDQAANGPRTPTACATQVSAPAAARASSAHCKVRQSNPSGLRTQSPIEGASRARRGHRTGCGGVSRPRSARWFAKLGLHVCSRVCVKLRREASCASVDLACAFASYLAAWQLNCRLDDLVAPKTG